MSVSTGALGITHSLDLLWIIPDIRLLKSNNARKLDFAGAGRQRNGVKLVPRHLQDRVP